MASLPPPSQTFTQDVTEYLAARIRTHVEEHGICVVGLSGGSTPVPVYTALGSMDLPWNSLLFFLADERCVSADDADSNQNMIRGTLLRSTTLRDHQFLVPNTSLPAPNCATDYAKQIGNMLTQHGHPHILILGMGDDGHIASLFPPLENAAFSNAIAIHTTTNTFAVHDRISLTLPVLTSAKEAVFLLKGEAKTNVWKEMEESKEDATRWPAKAVLDACEVTVFVG